MISYLKGVIRYKTGRFVVVEVNGVGYQVFCPEKLLAVLGAAQEKAELHVKLFVREDALELYGFQDAKELEFFELLLTVSGIGPRAAQVIGGAGPVLEIIRAIEKGDEQFFKGLPGVGSKKIKKVILELSGKLPQRGAEKLEQAPFRDAHRALISLGFSAQDAKETLEGIPQDITDSKEIVKQALRLLGKQT